MNVRRARTMRVPRSSLCGALILVLAAVLLAATPAFAQSGPDAAPSGSSGGPSPDPAPTAKRPTKPAGTPPAAVGTTTSPAPSTTVAPTPHNAAGHRTATKRSTHRSSAPKRRRAKAPTAALALPRVTPAHLVAPPSDGDDQARRLAIGGLSLLLLALASAMLLAFTLRVDRDRTLR